MLKLIIAEPMAKETGNSKNNKYILSRFLFELY